MSWRSSFRYLVVACAIPALFIGRNVSAQVQPAVNIRVFVTSGDGSTDFVDPDTKASVADVKKDFRGRKGIVVADSEVGADLVVRVLHRFRGRSGRSVAVATSPTTAIAAPIRERVVVASITVGDFTQEMNGAHTRSWGAASDKLVDQRELDSREPGADIGTPKVTSAGVLTLLHGQVAEGFARSNEPDAEAVQNGLPPRLKSVVDMAVFCQVSRPVPPHRHHEVLSVPGLSGLFVRQVRLVGDTAF